MYRDPLVGAGWQERSACRGEDPDLFFPIGETGPSLLQIDTAKAVCRQCPVVDLCRQWALETHEVYGIWGGTSEADRRLLHRDAARTAIGSASADT
ncbi:WhiB family transcriptional regulator [Streptomyces brasiliensis]|uniref:Transcriptional regulator WhiB n=1 Tax=Streptomyces brasiliensis TaxID=1954 RepID=A0A917P6F8_9ACTN|nr:WhiB family transcriptional regulator [Streptomyces brasiliensis]GGJ64031.1 transcriptional regulator WhiB [Streptomyces brasiliensis]